MVADKTQIVVSADPRLSGVQAHHRSFPEIRAQGFDAHDAARHLKNQLFRTLDSALTEWRREAIEQAIADVEEYSTSRH